MVASQARAAMRLDCSTHVALHAALCFRLHILQKQHVSPADGGGIATRLRAAPRPERHTLSTAEPNRKYLSSLELRNGSCRQELTHTHQELNAWKAECGVWMLL